MFHFLHDFQNLNPCIKPFDVTTLQVYLCLTAACPIWFLSGNIIVEMHWQGCQRSGEGQWFHRYCQIYDIINTLTSELIYPVLADSCVKHISNWFWSNYWKESLIKWFYLHLFLTIIWKTDDSVHFKLGVCPCCVNLNFLLWFGPVWGHAVRDALSFFQKQYFEIQ